MIDEAHQLTKDAFNALLKTLEEPPEYLKFVLATTDPEKMLPTVLSRCLQFNLRPMAPRDGARAPGARAGRPRGVAHEPASLRLLRAPRAARCATRCRSPTRRSPTAAARLDEAAVRAMLGSVDRRPRAALRRGAGARATARRVLAAVDALRAARPVGRRHARGNGRAAAADGGRAGRARRAGRRATRTRRRPRAWRGCCRPTRRSCSTASCCTAATSCRCARRVRGLTMVLLRLLAFAAGSAAAAAAGAAARDAAIRRRRRGAATAVATAAHDRLPPLRSDEPPPWVDCRAGCRRPAAHRAAASAPSARRRGDRRRRSAAADARSASAGPALVGTLAQRG